MQEPFPEEKSFLEKIPYPVYHFTKYLILVLGISMGLAFVVALVFHFGKGSPFYQTFLSTVAACGGALVVIGGLILMASAGLGAPKDRSGAIYVESLKYEKHLRDWKNEMSSRTTQGSLLFIYGFILLAIAVVLT